jgi:hypothetical protein
MHVGDEECRRVFDLEFSKEQTFRRGKLIWEDNIKECDGEMYCVYGL